MSASPLLPLHSIHTHIVSPSLCVAAAVACLPLCLFLEAHNMADMCFVIVSTSSSLLAYKDLIAPPHTHTHPSSQNNKTPLKSHWHGIRVVIIT